MQKFTQEQLMLYIYKEASPILMLSIEEAMKDDEALRKEIQSLRDSSSSIDKMKKEEPTKPSSTTMDAILKYAKNSKRIR